MVITVDAVARAAQIYVKGSIWFGRDRPRIARQPPPLVTVVQVTALAHAQLPVVMKRHKAIHKMSCDARL